MEIQIDTPDTPNSIISLNYTVFIPSLFWFNRNPGLAIPIVLIPYATVSKGLSQRSKNRKLYKEMVKRKKLRVDAINKIERWWQIILAKRTLTKTFLHGIRF